MRDRLLKKLTNSAHCQRASSALRRCPDKPGLKSGPEDEPDRTADKAYGAMRTQLVTGVLDYCGIADAGIEFLHGSLSDDRARADLLAATHRIGAGF